MSMPKPPSSLDNSCSVIHGKTLYSYTPEAFLSLNLEEGAKWKKLEMGEKVTGGVCVGTTPGDDSQAALFIVGGTGGSGDYAGLQKYTYATGKWTSVTPSDPVTKNRRWHASTYLKANHAIVVYAGTQNGAKAPGSEIFTIDASEPYAARSYGTGPYPAINPILLNWSDADVMMVGGDVADARVPLFNPTAGWRDSGASLANPLPADNPSVEALMINGDDGSKSLYAFDLGQSPNLVSRYVLQDAAGVPVHHSAPVYKDKRALTLDDWPAYNSTLAPATTRSGYAIAQGPNGMVVFSGGNNEKPISIFNAIDNSWMDTDAMLVAQDQKILSESTTSASSASSTEASSSTTSEESSSSTATNSIASSTNVSSTATSFSSIASTQASATSESTAAATTSSVGAAAVGSGSSGPSANAILGITLGTIIAFLGLLGLLLFLIRRHQGKQNRQAEAAQPQRGPAPGLDEKDPAAFANNFPPPGAGQFKGHQQRDSQESFSSMAILMGRTGQKGEGATSKPSAETNRASMDSDHKQFKSTIGKPIPQVNEHPAFQGHDEKGVAFDPSVAEPRARNGPLPTDDGVRRSSGWNRYWSGGSALQILGFGGSKRATVLSDQSSRYSEALSAAPQRRDPRVTQDSATVPPLNFAGAPEFNRVNTGSPVVSQHNSQIPFRDGVAGKIERPGSKDSSGYSSGIPESVAEVWDANDPARPWGVDRAPSSAYTPSFYHGAPSSGPTAGQPQGPSGVSTQPPLATASTSDMSWLNLGDRNQI